MANRLEKVALSQHMPGVPYQPAIPAYCVQVLNWQPARTVVTSYKVVTDANGATSYIPVFEQQAAGYVTQKQCYPAIAERKAIPAVTLYRSINGWDSGARSFERLEGDGHFEFKVGRSAIAVVVGISANDVTTRPDEQSHAFYIHGGKVDIMERGVVVARNVVAHSGSSLYRISRRGANVSYEVGNFSRESSLASWGSVALDASLYTSGDYVESPAIERYDQSGDVVGSMPAASGWAADLDDYAYIEARLPVFAGSAAGETFDYVTGQFKGFIGWASDSENFAFAGGALPAMTGAIYGGDLELQFVTVEGVMPAASGYALGLNGTVGYIDARTPAMSGWASDVDGYAFVEGELGTLAGSAVTEDPRSNEIGFTSVLVLDAQFASLPVRADSITSRLGFGFASSLTAIAGDVLVSPVIMGMSVIDGMRMNDQMISRLHFGMHAVDNLADEDGVLGEMDRQPQQIATNSATGAVSRYLDFNFIDFATIDGRLYGLRSDGLYVIGGADYGDDGVRGLLDLGANEFGTSQLKRMDSVLLGIYSDAQVSVSLSTDNGEHAYPARYHGAMARALVGKGMLGRQWNTTIEFEGASHLELDAVEWRVGASARRLGGLRR